MRPAGATRLALLAVLQAGAVGTFDALARQAQVPEQQARYTLKNLRRERVISVQHASDVVPSRTVRAIYAPAANDAPFDSLSFARQVWR